MRFFAPDVVVSFVDDSFIFSTKEMETPLVIPAYVTIMRDTKKVLAYGDEAKVMRGKEPENISVIRVLTEGLITDDTLAQSMYEFGMRAAIRKDFIVRPRVIIISRQMELHKRALKDMATAGGAREVYLLDLNLSAAIGMKLEIQKPEFHSVLTLSDDWFEFSVISLAGIVVKAEGAIGTRAFVEDIQNHLTYSRQFRPDFDTLTSKLETAGVSSQTTQEVAGWETWSGRTEQGRQSSQPLSREDMTTGMMPSLVRITERIKEAIRRLPKENQYSLSQIPIHATGSAMRIPGHASLLAKQLGCTVTPYASDINPSIEGGKVMLRELNFLREIKPSKG